MWSLENLPLMSKSNGVGGIELAAAARLCGGGDSIADRFGQVGFQIDSSGLI
jgi:hypothetical protein